jgi:hypothetical protein
MDRIKKSYVVANHQDKEAVFQELWDTVHAGKSIDASLDPAPSTEECDFCSARPVEWSYPARDFTAFAAVELDPCGLISHTHNSRGDWAACSQCHDLIESGNIPGLGGRMTRAFELGDDPLIQKVIFDQLDGFFANRTGPPVRCK